MNQLKLRFVHSYDDNKFDIDLTLPSQGISAIFGRSGAGKTTLINVVAGLCEPESGHVSINDHVLFDSDRKVDLPTHQRKVGYVFQESRLFPHYSVKGNLLYGVSVFDQEHFDNITELLALQALLARKPSELSGGEKQRVAIGRALLSNPDILLMDEPLASLDMPRKREVMPFLEELADRINIPILYVSHSLNEIVRLAKHITIIDDGKIVTSGSLEDVWASQAMRPWQSFSEQSSLFEGVVAEHSEQFGLTRVQFGCSVSLWVQQVSAALNTPIRLQVRANDVSIAIQQPQQTSIRNILPVKIVGIEEHVSGDSRRSVSVKLAMSETCYLWATITKWAKEELELVVGMHVYAQIKGVSVTQRDVVLSH